MIEHGFQVIRLASVDSTNAHLLRLLRDGAPAGTAVSAVEQTAGRGQRGRAWFARPGETACVSVSCREEACGLPFAAAIACARTFREREHCGVQACVRWPNDVVVDGRKLCGILVESAGASGIYVIGCGLNLNTRGFPPELAGIATSVLIETGRAQDVSVVEEHLLGHLWEQLGLLEKDGFAATLTRWRELDCTAGSRIRVAGPEGEYLAEAAGVDAQGHLVAKSGERFQIIAGASGVEWLAGGGRPGTSEVIDIEETE